MLPPFCSSLLHFKTTTQPIFVINVGPLYTVLELFSCLPSHLGHHLGRLPVGNLITLSLLVVAKVKIQAKSSIYCFSNPTKQIVPCESNAEEVSLEWSHHRISSTDSKVRAASTTDSGSERVKSLGSLRSLFWVTWDSLTLWINWVAWVFWGYLDQLRQRWAIRVTSCTLYPLAA